MVDETLATDAIVVQVKKMSRLFILYLIMLLHFVGSCDFRQPKIIKDTTSVPPPTTMTTLLDAPDATEEVVSDEFEVLQYTFIEPREREDTFPYGLLSITDDGIAFFSQLNIAIIANVNDLFLTPAKIETNFPLDSKATSGIILCNKCFGVHPEVYVGDDSSTKNEAIPPEICFYFERLRRGSPIPLLLPSSRAFEYLNVNHALLGAYDLNGIVAICQQDGDDVYLKIIKSEKMEFINIAWLGLEPPGYGHNYRPFEVDPDEFSFEDWISWSTYDVTIFMIGDDVVLYNYERDILAAYSENGLRLRNFLPRINRVINGIGKDYNLVRHMMASDGTKIYAVVSSGHPPNEGAILVSVKPDFEHFETRVEVFGKIPSLSSGGTLAVFQDSVLISSPNNLLIVPIERWN